MLKYKIAQLGFCKGNFFSEPIKGGHRTHNFLVEDQVESFFLRLGHDLDVHFVKRFN